MATYPYNYANLFSSINGRLHGKMGLVTNPRNIINDVVNEVSSLQLRSSKRRATLAPNLFNDIYQYAAPSDIDGNNLIDIQPQSMNRVRNNIWGLVSEAEFDQKKQSSANLVAFADHTFVRTLLISARTADSRTLTIANLNSLAGDGGNWTTFGQATNLQTDNFNFIKGSGAIEFDIATGGNTAGIVNTALNTFDLTNYKSAASVFTWVYINTVANVSSVTLRLGSSSSNYYSITATTPNDNTSFVNGYNLVRFDFNNKTTTGTPTDTACVYAALYLNLASSVVVDTAYRFNWLCAKQGNISNLIYYSSFPWQTIGGTLIKSSTVDTDYIVCDQDEYNLMVEKGVEVVGMAAREYQDSQLAATRYGRVQDKSGMSYDYKRRYPTESLQLTSSYYDFAPGSSGGDIRLTDNNGDSGDSTTYGLYN